MTGAFLDRLYANCTGGVVEVRSIPNGARGWATPGAWKGLGPFVTAGVRNGQNLVLGIATRKDTSSGTAGNLFELPAVFADVDVRTARERCAWLPFPPSFIIASGTFFHFYYLLREAANLTDTAERALALSVLRRLAAHLGADHQAAELARCLRLVGSLSFKHATPRPVTVVEQSGTVLNLSELDELLPAERTPHGRCVLQNRLREGGRNDALYGLVLSLRYRGVAPRVIIAMLHTANDTWCEVPLAGAELHTLLFHGLRQPDRADFLRCHADGAPNILLEGKRGGVACG